MTLRLPDHWLWDFWFASDPFERSPFEGGPLQRGGGDVHLFFLHAPRSLGDPELRHRNARIGHAVSRDLSTWTVLPNPLPEAPGWFDDRAHWTGSVTRAHNGTWYLFYSALSLAEDWEMQRILAATSTDLLHWQRLDLVLEADPRWYEKYEPDRFAEHWRDPYVVWDDESQLWHMLITARSAVGPHDERGVVGHATSLDLVHWQVHPPLTEPGEFGQLEVSQLVQLGGRWRIFFSATVGDHSAARLARIGNAAQIGTHYLTGEAKFGPYRLDSDSFLIGDEFGVHYGGRVLERDGRHWFFAWIGYDKTGYFHGELSDPMPLEVHPDGTVHLVPAATSP